MFLKFVEFIIVFAFILFAITQVMWPLIRGTKIIPMLRKERKLEETLAEARQEKVENELRDKIDKEDEYCYNCESYGAVCKNVKSPHYQKMVSRTLKCSSWSERKV